MARFDAVGLFWEDIAAVKPPKKEKPKAIPPEPVWLLPTYLPGLHEARTMALPFLSDDDLISAWQAGERMNYDIECYPNYFLIAIRSIDSGRYVLFECEDDRPLDPQQAAKLQWVVTHFTMVGFNIISYDNTMAALAAAGATTEQLWKATCMLIQEKNDKGRPKYKPFQILKAFNVKKLEIDSIDLIQYTALRPGLKLAAGRAHAPRMQDLPFVPGTYLLPDQKIIVRWYCVNDLDNNEIIYHRYIDRVKLREELSKKYGVDLRSSSDAQMAESIISTEIKRLTGAGFLSPAKIAPGTAYRFKPPKFVNFHSDILKQTLELITSVDFVVTEKGSLKLPPELKNLVITIGKGQYKLGLGGLHSKEKAIGYTADDDHMLVDIDATSYYPFLILNAGLTPQNLGRNFLIVYNGIVVSRVNAKQAGDIIMAEGLKITANGTFGKLGSKWSIMYAPDLLMQTTVTGQCSLLMYIEMMEHCGFQVISANTDGIVCKVRRDRKAEFDGLVKYWESATGFSTEETRYNAVYSRDVNNYIAVYETPQKGKLFKGKGIFNTRHPDKSADASTVDLKKNPANEICTNAVIELILRGTPIAHAIRSCEDVSQFVALRTVKGGGVYIAPDCPPEYLGKTVRWYHALGLDENSKIVYAKSGNKVPDSDGSRPMMTLTKSVPSDIDYAWYEQETHQNMINMGYISGEVTIEDEDEEDEEVSDELEME